MPDASSARDTLLANIDARVQKVITEETEHRRDWSGVAVALMLIGIFGWLTSLAWDAGGAYRLLEAATIPMLLVGIVGFSTSASKKKRDDRGNVQTS